MNRQNIKSVFKLVLVILIITFITDKVIFLALNKASDRVYTGQSIGKINHYLSIKDSADVIVFGSSRANHHIDVDLLGENTFNMGLDGLKIAYIATVIKVLPKNKKQRVIVSIDPENIFDQKYKGDDIKALNTKYHRIETIKQELNNSGVINPLQKFYWSIDYNNKVIGILKNLIRPKYNYKNYNGYDPLTVSETQVQIRNNRFKNIIDDPCDDLIQINPIAENYLKEIHRFCEENNKELIMVTTPYYRDNCDLDNIKLSELMNNLSITYWDYSNFFKENNKVDYWKDGTHLSKEGAIIFSKEFADKLSE